MKSGIYHSDIRKELLDSGRFVGRTSGVSMLPLLRQNRDIVIIESVNTERLPQKMDVVLYQRKDGANILHRMIGKRNGIYIIRGDNCYSKEFVEDKQLLGILIGIYRDDMYIDVKMNKKYVIYSYIWHYSYFFRYIIHKCKSLFVHQREKLIKCFEILKKRIKKKFSGTL